MSTSETTANPTLALELVLARNDLTSFVQAQTCETIARVGFTYEACPDAPSTYQQLRGAYAGSQANGTPLPISNQFCDSAIFLTNLDNVRFRFWHDVSHVTLGVSFRLEDELELGIWHLEQLERAGYPKHSLPWKVFQADIVGQIQLMALIGRFPIHQRRFVEDCVEYGTEIGLMEEIRRIPAPDAPCPSRSDVLITS